MNEGFSQLLVIVRGVWHRRWLMLITTSLICALGWPFVFILPDKYEVTTRVYLDTQSMLTPVLRGLAVESDVTEQTAQLLRRTLLSRPNLEKIARETDLYLDAMSPEAFEGVLKGLEKNIRIIGGGRDQIYTISYQSRESHQATRVVEELLKLFVEGALGATRLDTTSTQRFIDEQIQEYELQLITAENRLKEFKRKNIGLMPSDGRTYFAQYSAAREELQRTQLAYDEAIKRSEELNRQMAALEGELLSGSGATESGGVSQYDERIQSIETRLDDLRFQFTDSHPDIISTSQILEELKARRKGELEGAIAKGGGATLLDNNVVYQDLKVAMGAAAADVAGLTVRVKQHKKAVEHLQGMVDTMPQVEAELVKLDRDYNVIRANYEELVRRRESVKLSFEAGRRADDVQFKVIDPPREPLMPIGPNRPILSTGVFVAGIGAGVALIWLLMQLKPTFGSQHDIRRVSSYPVFGSVSMVLSPQQLKKVKLQFFSFALSAFALFAVYVLVMLMHLINAGMFGFSHI